MEMNGHVRKLVGSMNLYPFVTEGNLEVVEAEMGMVFPIQYRDFMLESNGAEGKVGENSYLAIWPIEDIVSLNRDAKVEEFTPGLVFFASDGGGMAYAFDKRCEGMPIVEIPDDSIHIEDAKLRGNTFNEFLQNLYHAE